MSEQAAVRAAGAADVEAAVAIWTLSHVVRRNGRPLPEAHIQLARRRMSAPGALLLLARCPAGAESEVRIDSAADVADTAADVAGADVTADPGDDSVADRAAAPGVVVGTILGVQGLDQDGAGPPVPGLLHISLLSVAPDRWGQRIGRLLVDEVLDRASVRGFEQAQLWTHADNLRANRLYKAIGFRRSGRVRIDDWGELLVHYRRPVRI
jgi:ribosomal protein S18 acetylase RimI-like enzyme